MKVSKIELGKKVWSNESDNGSPEWMTFLSQLKAKNFELKFINYSKKTKQDKFEIVKG